MLRALVNLSRDLADDIAEACGTLKTKGGATKHERRTIKTGRRTGRQQQDRAIRKQRRPRG